MIWHIFTLLFVGLKLAGVIGWSWWLVVLPSLILIGISIALLVLAAAIAIIAAIKDSE